LKRGVELRVAALSAILATAESKTGQWLGAAETARLDAMGSQRRRRQFTAGHWLARDAAAGFTGTSPDDWLLDAASSGMPVLLRRDTTATPDIHVSLSHSGEMVAVAVASFPLGIDLESASRVRDWLGLAGEVFAPEECHQLRLLPAADRQALFLRHWTLKEASGKRDGTGLRPSLARTQCARECAEPEAIATTWQFDGHCVALVGESDMRTSARGIPVTAQQRFWQLDA
jgi:4'-phosphopantetheinyl transferase